MSRPPPPSKSRFVAAAVTISAVLVMLAPLRWGSRGDDTRQAGWLPLLNAGDLVDTDAFHRLSVAASRDQASAEPLVRPLHRETAP